LSDAGELVELTVKPNFRELGKVYGKRTQQVATAITTAAAADVDAFVSRFREGTMTIEIDGETLPLAGDMLVISETPRSGWTVAAGGADTVALDLELTHELRLVGMLRDIVRLVQDARKNAGYEVTDRIELHWRVGGAPAPAEAIRTHEVQLASEVLATAVHEGGPEGTGWYETEDEELGLHLWLRRT
jgi:isoleucyl-tRNA synthetase